MVWLIGVDVGGTFTDFYAFDDAGGRERVHKTPSTPDNPARAILDGLDALCRAEGIVSGGVRAAVRLLRDGRDGLHAQPRRARDRVSGA